MRAMLGCTAAVLALSLSLSADDKKDEKIDPAKLVGLWEDTESKSDRIRFHAKNKIEIIEVVGNKQAAALGTYKVDGNKLTTNFSGNDNDNRVRTIEKLTDEYLVLVDDKKKSTTYKRLKDK